MRLLLFLFLLMLLLQLLPFAIFHAVPIINGTERKLFTFNVLLARDSVPNFPSTSFPEATAARGLVAVKNYRNVMRWRRWSSWDAITSAPAWEAQAIRAQSLFTYIMIWSCSAALISRYTKKNGQRENYKCPLNETRTHARNKFYIH